MLEVPRVVRRKAELAGATDWLATVPETVAELERDWAIEVGRPYADATEALVCAVLCADGSEAVLKLVVPRAGRAAEREILALRLASGDGMVRLLRDDVSRGALLLARLGRPLHELGLPARRRQDILCDLAARVWRPAAGLGLPTGAEKARWLAGFIATTWEDLGRPCSEPAVDQALVCAGRREAAFDPDRARLVHGDVHMWNALQDEDGFALIDPDGLLADPEYDLGVIMREDPAALVRDGHDERVHRLARRTGLDPLRIAEWGVVERVSTGLLLVQVGLREAGEEMLRAAEVVAGPSARRS